MIVDHIRSLSSMTSTPSTSTGLTRLTYRPEAHLFGVRALEAGCYGGIVQADEIPKQSSMMRLQHISSPAPDPTQASPDSIFEQIAGWSRYYQDGERDLVCVSSWVSSDLDGPMQAPVPTWSWTANTSRLFSSLDIERYEDGRQGVKGSLRSHSEVRLSAPRERRRFQHSWTRTSIQPARQVNTAELLEHIAVQSRPSYIEGVALAQPRNLCGNPPSFVLPMA